MNNSYKYILFAILILCVYSCNKVDAIPWDYTSYTISDDPHFSTHKIKITPSGLLAAGGHRYSSGAIFYFENDDWEKVHLPAHRNKAFYDIAVHETTGKVTSLGLDGNIIYQPSLHSSWEYIDQPHWVWMRSAAYIQDELWIVSGEAFHSGKIFTINDHQELLLKDTFEMELNHISKSQDDQVFLLGYGSVLYLNSQGHWDYLNIEGDHFKDISYTNSFAYLIGYEGSIWSIHLHNLKTSKILGPKSLTHKMRFRAIQMLDSNEGYIVGDQGLILYTQDAWNSFKRYEVPEFKEVDFLSLNISSSSILWIGTSNAHILKIKL